MIQTFYRHLHMVSLVCAMVLPSIPVAGQSRDDEVMVSKCSEVYEFKMKGGQPIVKNKTVIEYESLRQYDVKIQPAAFYGDNIKLDEARCDGFSANYRSATPENVFFDDSRVCYFDVTLGKWGRKRRMTYERTFTDLHYFTRIVLGEQYFVKQKTVTFILPKGFEHYRLVDKNMSPAVTIEHKDKGGSRVVTYTINDMAPIKQEEAMPTVASVYPTVFVVGSFKDAADMFAWGRQLSDVDTTIPSLNEILTDINRECHSDLDKIKNTYAWVQNNIRYVAFEEGISGHQPDKPAEVVRKRYGDCKGMALLLKTLLVAQGFDARLTDVGTREASCLMSEIPTLAAINHAICTLEWQGKTYYLDATCNHIPLGHIPSNVQGMEVMVEVPGGAPSLRTVPVLPASTNCDSVHIDLTLSKAGELTGTITRCVKGDMKEMLLSAYDSRESQQRLMFERNALNDDDHANKVSDATWVDRDCRSECAVLTGKMTDNHSVQQIEGEVYVELDPDNMLFTNPIDTNKRENDYTLPMPCRQVREVILQLPEGVGCDELPEDYNESNQYADMSCTWQRQGSLIIYRKVMNLRQTRIKREDITTWNANLKRWQSSSHEAVVLK
ncbi:MAG: transglutaminase domain-containing protein [Muribaculaceae bacterium]|nr:transglutaminase domain-containing protein [Muribaculaceae bacterium]